MEEMKICEECKAAVIEGRCNCVIEAEQSQQDVEAQAEVMAPEEEKRFTIDDLVKIPGAPSKEQIERWKVQFRGVYVLPLSPKEVYVWRYLNYGEWMGIMTNKDMAANEAMLQQQIVQQALLWPRLGPLEIQASRAGLLSTLFGVIMQGSYFLPPEVAAALCDEL